MPSLRQTELWPSDGAAREGNGRDRESHKEARAFESLDGERVSHERSE